MCGIVGYSSTSNSIELSEFVSMIKSLDYRGYDSWGFTFKDADQLKTEKQLGKIETPNQQGSATFVIGHTRWATHGKVTKDNTHPHTSNSNKISLVHNGIIENHQELRNKLKDNGFNFYGETDTEVIPNLIEFHLRTSESVLEAFKKTLDELKGTFAITFLHDKSKKIFFARRDSPLTIGVDKDSLIVSSDVTSFIDRTKKVIYLEDGDYGYINSEIKIFNKEKEVHREISEIDWDVSKAKKGDFKHFMLKEISEQVDTVKQALIQDSKLIEKITNELKSSEVYIVACGSSYNAAKAAEGEFLKNGLIPRIIHAHEFEQYEKFLSEKSTIIAISQSGETLDLINAVKIAKTREAKINAIVNVQGSSLTRLSDNNIFMNVGPEICVLSTKSYTAQVAILMLLASSLINKPNESKQEIEEIVRHIYYLTSESARKHTKELSQILRYSNHIFTIGRGRDYATAMEAALKIKEVSYIHAEGFAGGEIKHGPIAMIEHGTPCIVFVPNKNNQDILSNAQELKSRGAFIIGISEKKDETFDYWIKVLGPDKFSPILRIIPIQALSYYLAIMKGLDPDKPRNLAKSVTVK
ncbi:glutamine--fructose-6-phosphate transaminase (isomerizing) [Candidatus Woesearchaeota archaeon]|jgi:glutamine---fructose-6-phosphate transaminase (isomerizing)|nr:glutamine--fructose-6-phosphate transaminase (isomerizing) [Candidatus Woesearchaeota archaeon]MBT6023545.1 glutamine--fructose-6-phosphate transaminase (isomerizing) [Candidatus Woesearchaeota archaeon]